LIHPKIFQEDYKIPVLSHDFMQYLCNDSSLGVLMYSFMCVFQCGCLYEKTEAHSSKPVVRETWSDMLWQSQVNSASYEHGTTS